MSDRPVTNPHELHHTLDEIIRLEVPVAGAALEYLVESEAPDDDSEARLANLEYQVEEQELKNASLEETLLGLAEKALNDGDMVTIDAGVWLKLMREWL